MELQLKLNTAFAEITPKSFFLNDNEEVRVIVNKPFKGKGVLIINAFSYVENQGVFTIPPATFNDVIKIEVLDVLNDEVIKRWKVKEVKVLKNESGEYDSELAFYKENYKALLLRVKTLEEYKENVTKDIANLTAFCNALNCELTAVREEMSL